MSADNCAVCCSDSHRAPTNNTTFARWCWFVFFGQDNDNDDGVGGGDGLAQFEIAILAECNPASLCRRRYNLWLDHQIIHLHFIFISIKKMTQLIDAVCIMHLPEMSKSPKVLLRLRLRQTEPPTARGCICPIRDNVSYNRHISQGQLSQSSHAPRCHHLFKWF